MKIATRLLKKISMIDESRKVDEAIAVNYNTKGRVEKFLKLISVKYKLGEPKGFKVKGSEHYIQRFGPTTNKLIKGKYVYLLFDYADTKRAKSGFITHFAVSAKELSAGFVKTSTGYEVSGLKFKPIPKDFVKFEHVMSLVIGAGADFENDTSKITTAVLASDNGEEVLDINKRFEIMAKLVRIVSMKLVPGMIIVGTGGLGKTYTVMETLKELNMLEERDFVHVHGAKLTTTAFYALLHNNPEKLIIFDDSDSVLASEDNINMLKSALDSGSGPRKVTYMSPTVTAMGLETTFEFKGQIIFISNKRMVDFDQPLISRSLPIDVTMTRDEVFERMHMIVSKLPDPEEKALKEKALKFIQDYSIKFPGKPRDLNMRTLGKVATVLKADSDGGEDIASYLLSVS